MLCPEPLSASSIRAGRKCKPYESSTIYSFALRDLPTYAWYPMWLRPPVLPGYVSTFDATHSNPNRLLFLTTGPVRVADSGLAFATLDRCVWAAKEKRIRWLDDR